MMATPAIILIAALFLSSGCISIRSIHSREQISISDAEKIITGIEEQGDMVRSFYSLGIVSIKGWILDSDADILIACVRDPFSMKIEITHSWGAPVLHVLIKDNRLEVLSFQEKTIYLGAFTPEALSRFLPGFSVDQAMLWSILSGRPPILKHEVVGLQRTDRISLSDNDGTELEAIYLPFKGPLPGKVSFSRQSLDVSFSDYKEKGGIFYAGETTLNGIKGGKKLNFKAEKMALNTSIPDQIFTLEKPSTYQTVNLDYLDGNTENLSRRP